MCWASRARRRFMRIILPQVVKRIVLPVSNEVITLVKDTALVTAVGLVELYRVARNAANAVAPLSRCLSPARSTCLSTRPFPFSSTGPTVILAIIRVSAMLLAENIYKSFNDNRVLRGVSLRVDKGRWWP